MFNLGFIVVILSVKSSGFSSFKWDSPCLRGTCLGGIICCRFAWLAGMGGNPSDSLMAFTIV